MRTELQIATEIAQAAGAILLKYFRKDPRVDRKEDNEPVTEADLAAESYILQALGRHFPNDGILSEEHSDKSSWRNKQRAWLVDPMDGTKDFVAGRDGFSVMIGLIDQGSCVLGVVFQPTTGRTYRGTVQRSGCYGELLQSNNTTELNTSSIAHLNQLRLVASASHRNDRLDTMKKRLGIDGEFNVGSVGVKVGLVANGEYDLYINPDGKCRLWDVCAPHAILTASGGVLTDLRGDKPCYLPAGDSLYFEHGVVASNGMCHAKIIEQIADLI